MHIKIEEGRTRLIILGVILVCLAAALSIQIQQVYAQETISAGTVTGTLTKWHPVTVSFAGPQANEADTNPNPFLDYRLQVTFTAPSGQQVVVPGFFDGDGNGGGSGNVWRVRFSPDQSGTWNYSASFRQGDNVAVDLNPNAGTATSFNGDSGSFAIADRNPNAPGFLSQGRLEYVGGHYLKFADGSYWIKGGADSPENLLGYADFDNTVDQSGGAGTSGLPNGVHTFAPHVSDWQSGDPTWGDGKGKGLIGALNYLSSQNVNSVYFLPMNLGGDGRETYPFIGASNNGSDELQYDISKLNQWNIVLNHAQEQGIALHFVLAETEVGNETWLDNGQLGVERQLYYRELIARFGYLLAVKWNLSEENDFSVSNLRAFADYIQALDWAEHPITVHTHPNNFQDYNQIVGESRFDATSIQYAPDQAGNYVETWRANSANAGHPWVLDMDENSPANTGLTDSNYNDLRKRVLYDVYFSGGNIEWYFGYHSLPLGGDMRTENFRTRQGMWEDMWHARSFMQDNLPFWEMNPADNLLSGEDGAFGGGEVFAKPGEAYAIYLPDASPSGSLDLSSVSGTYELRWYNPRNGQFAGSPQSLSGGASRALGSPPSDANNDWVALVQRTGGGGACVREESGGLLIMEAENLAVTEDWQVLSVDGGYSGSGYIEWKGQQYFNDPSHGLIEQRIEINTPGVYRFNWRNQHVVPPGSEHNDSWVSFPDAADFYAQQGGTTYWPKGSGKTPNPNGSSADGFFKVYNGAMSWSWVAYTSDNENFPIFVRFDQPGTYTMKMAARSAFHQVDRIALYKVDSVSAAEAENLSTPISPCVGGNPNPTPDPNPSPTPPPNGPAVERLVLVDAAADVDLFELRNGQSINLFTLGTTELNIRAEVNGQVSSVQFGLNNNPNYRTENISPYTLEGDNNGDYYSWTPGLGSYTVSVTPYAGGDASGQAGNPFSLTFNLISIDPATLTEKVYLPAIGR